MGTLHIALQDGFIDEPVTITVNGEEVYNEPHVKTRFQISLADSVDIPLSADQAEIKITLPSRDITHTLNMDVTQTPYLGISLTTQGEVMHRLSDMPFGYV